MLRCQDSLPEWSKGVDSSSTSASCVGSNPTAVILRLSQLSSRLSLSLSLSPFLLALLLQSKRPRGPMDKASAYGARGLQVRVLPGSFARPPFANFLKQVNHATALGFEPGSLRSCLGHVEPRPLLAWRAFACVSLLLRRASPRCAHWGAGVPRLPKLQLSLSHPDPRCLVCRDGRQPEASKAHEARPQLAWQSVGQTP